MRNTTKDWYEMTITERIRDAGWWLGTESEWQALPMPSRESIAFERTGCKFAYPTWGRPVDCVHTPCLIARGVLPVIASVNRQLRAERESGWFRFIEDRKLMAQLYRAFRNRARQTGVYDIWKLDTMSIVYAGVGGLTRGKL